MTRFFFMGILRCIFLATHQRTLESDCIDSSPPGFARKMRTFYAATSLPSLYNKKKNKKKTKKKEMNMHSHPSQETPQFSESILCSSALVKRVKQLQIPDEDSAGGDYYQLTYPN